LHLTIFVADGLRTWDRVAINVAVITDSEHRDEHATGGRVSRRRQFSVSARSGAVAVLSASSFSLADGLAESRLRVPVTP
jgi:hypothetical protein